MGRTDGTVSLVKFYLRHNKKKFTTYMTPQSVKKYMDKNGFKVWWGTVEKALIELVNEGVFESKNMEVKHYHKGEKVTHYRYKNERK